MNLRNIFNKSFLKSTKQLQWHNLIRQSSSESLKVEKYVDVKNNDDDKILLSRPKIVSSNPIKFVQKTN